MWFVQHCVQTCKAVAVSGSSRAAGSGALLAESGDAAVDASVVSAEVSESASG